MTTFEIAVALYKLHNPNIKENEVEEHTKTNLKFYKGREVDYLHYLSEEISSKYSKDVAEKAKEFGFSIEDVNFVCRDLEGNLHCIDLGRKGYLSNSHGLKKWSFSHQPSMWE